MTDDDAKEAQAIMDSELAKHTADLLLRDAITTLKAGKPGDRSEDDRKWAIVITEVEKVRAILRGFLNV